MENTDLILKQINNLKKEITACKEMLENKCSYTTILFLKDIKKRLPYSDSWYEKNIERLEREIPMKKTKNTNRYYCREKDFEVFLKDCL